LLAFVAYAARVDAQQTAATPEPPVVVTMGEAVLKRAPDRAWVTISAESRARNPRDAQRANAEAMNDVIQRLKGAGLTADALRTISYDLQPEFDYVSGKQTLRGYLARNAIEVRVDDLQKLGEILDVAVGAGATSVSGIRFDLRDRTGVEREALRQAVEDARSRANAAAVGAGMKVDRVIRIEDQRVDITPPPPRPLMTMRAEMAVPPPPPVIAGELEIKASVTLTAIIR
jgi:uncharacterized protein YggE